MGKNPFPTVQDPADDEPPFVADPEPTPETPRASVNSPAVPAEGEVGISFKFGTGFEAPMLHFKARSMEVLADLTGYDRGTETGSDLLFGLVEYCANGSKFVTSKYTEVTGRKLNTTTGGGGFKTSADGPRKGTPPEAAEPPAWMGPPPSCDHGPRKYVSKIKSDGSRWHAWGCSGEQGDNCNPGLKFVNAPK
jgi:hypothetical protein